MKRYMVALAACLPMLAMGLAIGLAGGLATGVSEANAAQPDYKTKSLPIDRILKAQSKPQAVYVLLSDADGWSEDEQTVANAWSAAGAVVVGVDMPAYLQALKLESRTCLYLVSDIEGLARQIHRAEGMETYAAPVVAGIGEGATLALAIAAQTPASTIAATLAVDPGAVVPLAKPLCTPAEKTPQQGGIRYGLTKGRLPGAVDVVLTEAATPEGRDHVARLAAEHPDIAVTAETGRVFDTLAKAGLGRLSRNPPENESLDLPLVELPIAPRYDTLAIIYSGDGGWRDIDQKLGQYLQEAGVPVVGVDALRYFWSEREPAQTAADLSRIIAIYRARFGVSRVALIGYSFGANILPLTYSLLPQTDRDLVDLVSLLAPSRQADFEIAVTGWMGIAGAGKHGDPVEHLANLEAVKIQCIYGAAEKDSACRALQLRAPDGVQLVERPGGHHFDGNYRRLADVILARIGGRGQ